MGLIDTFWGALFFGCLGIVLIRLGRIAIDRAVAAFRLSLERDPHGTLTQDLMLALARGPRNPVVWAICLWLFGWGLTILGFGNFFQIGWQQ